MTYGLQSLQCGGEGLLGPTVLPKPEAHRRHLLRNGVAHEYHSQAFNRTPRVLGPSEGFGRDSAPIRSLGPSSALECGAGDGGPDPGNPDPHFPGRPKDPLDRSGRGRSRVAGLSLLLCPRPGGEALLHYRSIHLRSTRSPPVPRSFALFGSGPRTADTSSSSKAGPTPSSVAPTATWDPRGSAVVRNAIASTPFPGTTCVHS